MRKTILLMHVSLDGFVGGPNGEMDWIHVDDELFDFVGTMTGHADTALYGRVTYQMMESYWPTAGDQPNASKHDIEHSQWYNSVTKVVISRTMKESEAANTQFIGDDIATQIQQIKQKPGKNILMIGSPSASHYMTQHQLIDEYWLFVYPVLIGEGIPLFKNISERMNLNLIASKVYPSGVIGLHYGKK